MKRSYLILSMALFLQIGLVSAQITYNTSYTTANTASSGNQFYFTKLTNAGYKYVLDDHPNKTIKLYNTNHSLFATINTPTFMPGSYIIAFISDHLFDLNNDIEYALMTLSTGTSASTQYPKVYVYKDNGTQVFFKDSATFSNTTPDEIFFNQSSVFYDGTTTCFKLLRYVSSTTFPQKWDIYTLPGYIPCIQCSQQPTTVVTGNKSELPGTAVNDPLFYPNPASDQVKLKYDLPKNCKTAVIKIQDIQGKLIEEFKVDHTFDFIYIPADYNSGLYFYSLIIDGKVIKTEKIIINK